MSKATKYIQLLTELLSTVAAELLFAREDELFPQARKVGISLLGDVEDRELSMQKFVEEMNAYLQVTDGQLSLELRIFIVRAVPKFLLSFLALRFPSISDPTSAGVPKKADLGKFPQVVCDTGLYVPVTAFLRLIATCLIDREARVALVDSGNVKTVVSHMVDDPLHPYQREAAIFVLKMLTTDFHTAQIEIDRFSIQP